MVFSDPALWRAGAEPLFGKLLDEPVAAALIDRGKMVIQSRACTNCHTFFGNGAYYAPDLTKAWLDPDWEPWQAVTGADSREGAMVKFLVDPEQYRTWTRGMPNLGVTEEEAQAVVACLISPGALALIDRALRFPAD